MEVSNDYIYVYFIASLDITVSNIIVISMLYDFATYLTLVPSIYHVNTAVLLKEE